MTPYYADDHLTLYGGDCREVMASMPERSVHTVVTSPPYWGLRDYGVADQLGLEATPEAYVEAMVAVFREVRRVLRDDGTLWLNLGDSYCSHDPGERRDGEFLNPNGVQYDKGRKSGPATRNRAGVYARHAGLKPKDLVGIPWRVAFALQADGWYLRSDIIWSKPNPMPESVTDRPTKAHEYLFLLSKSARYHYDAGAVREASTTTRPELLEFGERQDVGLPDGRTDDRRRIRTKKPVLVERSVATAVGCPAVRFPRKLVEPCVKAGCPADGTVLDPFAGSGTTLLVAQALGRKAVGIDLNPDYLAQAMHRNRQTPLGLVG